MLCASDASEVTLFSFSDGKGAYTKTRTLSFPDPVDGWTWVSINGPPQLVIMSAGQLHRFRPSVSTAEDAAPHTAETLTGPAVRGRCIGVVGAEEEGGAQRLVIVTSGPCGLEHGLRQRQLQTPAVEQGVLNATLLELRRTQRPLGLVDMQLEQQLQGATGTHEADGATEGSGGVIDLVGKIGSAAAGADGPPNSSIPAGLLLHNLGGLSLEGRQQPRSAQQDTLSLARCPFPRDGAPSSPLLDDARLLASAPLQPPLGPLQPPLGPDPSTCGTWSAGMLASEGDCVVVGSHLSPILLAYRLHSPQRNGPPSPSTFGPLPLLVLPDGFRARGLALLPDGRRAFCLAARRHPQPEGGGPAVLTGQARYKLCLFAFDLGGAGDGGQGQGQGRGKGAAADGSSAAAVVNEKEGEGEGQGQGEGQGDDSVVLAFLEEFRGEVLGRLAALEAAVAAQGERLARLEERSREGREL